MVQAGALTSASEHEGPGSEDEDSGAGSGGEMPAEVAGGASSGANANGGFFVTSGARPGLGQLQSAFCSRVRARVGRLGA